MTPFDERDIFTFDLPKKPKKETFITRLMRIKIIRLILTGKWKF